MLTNGPPDAICQIWSPMVFLNSKRWHGQETWQAASPFKADVGLSHIAEAQRDGVMQQFSKNMLRCRLICLVYFVFLLSYDLK